MSFRSSKSESLDAHARISAFEVFMFSVQMVWAQSVPRGNADHLNFPSKRNEHVVTVAINFNNNSYNNENNSEPPALQETDFGGGGIMPSPQPKGPHA